LRSRHDPADRLHHIVEDAERVARHLAGMDRMDANIIGNTAQVRSPELAAEARAVLARLRSEQ
jgi:hypothetical protein